MLTTKAHSDIPLQAQADEVEREATARVVDIAENAKPLAGHGGNRKTEQLDNYQVDIPSIDGGTDPVYLTARIARDRPDILERMKAGEYKPPINSKYEKLFRAQFLTALHLGLKIITPLMRAVFCALDWALFYCAGANLCYTICSRMEHAFGGTNHANLVPQQSCSRMTIM